MLHLGLFPKQWEFVNYPDRFSAFIGGIGSGKSQAGVAKGIIYALEHPKSWGLVLGPTFRNLKFTTRARWFQMLPEDLRLPGSAGWNENDGHLVLKHPTETISAPGRPTVAAAGSEVFFWSAEGEAVIDRIRGIELAWAHIEEGPLVDEVVFNVTAGRLRQPGFPGQAWVTGTHKGHDWVYRLFETDEDTDGRPREKVGPIIHAAIEDNTFLAPDYVASLRRLYRGAWAVQELEGGHAKFEGLIYPTFDRSTHIWHGDLPRFKRVVYGIDWGFLYAPVIVVGETFEDQLLVAAEWYERDVQPEEQLAAAKAFTVDKRFGRGQFFTDKSRPENRNSFNLGGLYAPEFEQGKVDEGIREVSSRLAKRSDGKYGLLVHESCRNVITEYESYVWAKRPKALSPGEEWKQEPAAGQKDHGMDALRYAVMGLRVAPAVSGNAEPDDYYRVRRGGFARS